MTLTEEIRKKYDAAISEARKNNDDATVARLQIGLSRTYLTADMLASEWR